MKKSFRKVSGLAGRWLLTSVSVVALAASNIGALWPAQSVSASGNPTFTGGSAVSGQVGHAVNISDLQVSAPGNPTVPMTLRVTHGSLTMTDTTGLTFVSGTSGSLLSFSGSLSDVNTDLSTLQYTASTLGSDTLEATMVGADQVYDPNNGHVYQFVDTNVTWDDAFTASSTYSYNGLTGYLATVTSSNENDYLNARLPNGGWIGASDAATEGQWQWIDGPENGTLFFTGNGGNGTGAMVSGQYSNWNNGEPNNSGGNENCAQFLAGGSGQWNDLNCSSQVLPYVVEFGGPGSLPSVAFTTVPITNTAGTSTVADCAALEALDTTAGQYDTIKLTHDVDCTGQTVHPLFNGGFYGTFDGQGYTIKGFDLNDPSGSNDALFYYTNGATIENLKLTDGSVVGNYEVGGLVAEADNTNFSNITSDWTVTSTGYYAGGLAGGGDYSDGGNHTFANVVITGDISAADGYAGGLLGWQESYSQTALTVQHSYTTGNISSNSAGSDGGLLGTVYVDNTDPGNSVIIEDSYARGDVSSPTQGAVGGLVGSAYVNGNNTGEGTFIIRRSYASGNIAGDNGVGGLVGYVGSLGGAGSTVEIDNSFAAGALTTNDPNSTGGIIGDNEANSPYTVTSNNNYYDQTRTGTSTCSGVNSISDCTSVNVAGADANYFFNNVTNPPLNTWNFSSVWAHNLHDWPTFGAEDDGDGVSNAVEAAAPNNGDANGDGMPDNQQANVASLVDPVNNNYVAVAAPNGCNLTTVSSNAESANATADSGFSYPLGLVNFNVNCGSTGFTTTITQYYYGAAAKTYVARKYNPNTHAYFGIPDAQITTVTIGGQSVLKLTYQVTDGGPLDSDGTANGVVVDPAGLAVNDVGVPNTGFAPQND